MAQPAARMRRSSASKASARRQGFRRVAFVAHAREHAGQLRARQKGDDCLADGRRVDRPLGAEILHDAHRPIVIAFGDDRHRAVLERREARALGTDARELGDERMTDRAQLFRRPGPSGQLEQLRRQLVTARRRVLAQVADRHQGLQQVVRGGAMQPGAARDLGQAREPAARRDDLDDTQPAFERLVRDAFRGATLLFHHMRAH
jgi:hypothetical protein